MTRRFLGNWRPVTVRSNSFLRNYTFNRSLITRNASSELGGRHHCVITPFAFNAFSIWPPPEGMLKKNGQKSKGNGEEFVLRVPARSCIHSSASSIKVITFKEEKKDGWRYANWSRWAADMSTPAAATQRLNGNTAWSVLVFRQSRGLIKFKLDFILILLF